MRRVTECSSWIAEKEGDNSIPLLRPHGPQMQPASWESTEWRRGQSSTQVLVTMLSRINTTYDIYSPYRYVVLIYKYRVGLESPFIICLDNCQSLSLGSYNKVPEKVYKVWSQIMGTNRRNKSWPWGQPELLCWHSGFGSISPGA